MDIGLQTFDEYGNIILDTTTLVGLAIGSINTGTSPGSYSDDRLLKGNPFVISQADLAGLKQISPVVTVSGGTISWVFPSGTAERSSCIVVYGIT